MARKNSFTQSLAVGGGFSVSVVCRSLLVLRVYFFENFKIFRKVRKRRDVLKSKKMGYLALLITKVVQLARIFLKDTLDKVAIVFSDFFIWRF